MRSKLAFGMATIAVVLATLPGQATAADVGSTDIYRNQFQESFGAPVVSKSPRGLPDHLEESTDIWSDEFSESFGASEHLPNAQTARPTGSTDVWGNGFRASFGDLAPSLATGPARISEAAGNAVR